MFSPVLRPPLLMSLSNLIEENVISLVCITNTLFQSETSVVPSSLLSSRPVRPAVQNIKHFE